MGITVAALVKRRYWGAPEGLAFEISYDRIRNKPQSVSSPLFLKCRNSVDELNTLLSNPLERSARYENRDCQGSPCSCIEQHYLYLWPIDEPTAICQDLSLRCPADAVARVDPPVIGLATVSIGCVSVLGDIPQ